MKLTDSEIIKDPVITPEIERRMRVLANYVIDRMLQDYKRGLLKVPPKQAILLDKVIKMKSMNSVQE